MKSHVVDERLARAGDADVESLIIDWARSGIIAEAARDAIAEHHRLGHAVMIIENEVVYNFHPDGRKEELRRLSARSKTNYSSGIAYL